MSRFTSSLLIPCVLIASFTGFKCFLVFGYEGNERNVDEENRHHVSNAIESLLHQDQIVVDHNEASELQRVEETTAQLVYSPPSNTLSADIRQINRTYSEILSQPRSDAFSKSLKNKARKSIMKKFREYGLETFTQNFTARKNYELHRGMNIVGLLPGSFRGKSGDRLLIVGAHYDTVDESPGVDDNGSGVSVLIELARLMYQRQEPLDYTLMFVAFDLEELGLLGSIAFVREYLVPKELVEKRVKFMGAYVIDMVLNYDSSLGSQTLPRDIQLATPDIARQILQDGNKGDFLGVWMRRKVDSNLMDPLRSAWDTLDASATFKIRSFEPPLPSAAPSSNDLYKYGTYTRSDHASFWYHNLPNYPKTLNAVLLTDMGPWRGVHGKCYHSRCDDKRQLTSKNLRFLGNTINALYKVITDIPPKFAPTTPVPERRVISRTIPTVRRHFRPFFRSFFE